MAGEPTCRTCPWHHEREPRYQDDRTIECRRRAPHTDVGGGIFPTLYPDDWCGEHPDRREVTS